MQRSEVREHIGKKYRGGWAGHMISMQECVITSCTGKGRGKKTDYVIDRKIQTFNSMSKNYIQNPFREILSHKARADIRSDKTCAGGNLYSFYPAVTHCPRERKVAMCLHAMEACHTICVAVGGGGGSSKYIYKDMLHRS